jgi:hypothetical protein
MVAVLRGNDDIDSAHWPTLTHDLLTAAGAASTAVDRAIRQFQVAHVYVECDETGNSLLTQHSEGGWWVDAYSRPEWVPGVDSGQDVDLLSLTGVELTRRLPAGTGLRLDRGQRHCLVVVPAAVSMSVESVEDGGSPAGGVR